MWNLRFLVPMYVRNCVGNFEEDCAESWRWLPVGGGERRISMILVLTHERGRSFPMSFFKSLKFSLLGSFASFVRFILRYLNVFETIVTVPAFHRICCDCDWGLCSLGLFRSCLPSGPSAILNKLCLLSGLSSPLWLSPQKTRLPVSPPRDAMVASGLSCSAAHLCLVFSSDTLTDAPIPTFELIRL